MRLQNHDRAQKNREFVRVELDRIEAKIQVLAESSVNRQDPDFLSSQIDSVTESMRSTEKAISELHQITGLVDELQEPPAILEADWGRWPNDERPLAREPRPGLAAAWAARLSDLYFSGTTSMFVLHGNVPDLVPMGAEPAAGYGTLADFLAAQIFGRWDLVLYYDLARGLRAFAGPKADRLKEMWSWPTARSVT